jgi:dUTP pyrophosphatase
LVYELNIYNTVFKFLGGVIDSDYRGDIKVIIVNNGANLFRYQRGLKIAQLIIEQILHHDAVFVENLDETLRGESGFGSSGLY